MEHIRDTGRQVVSTVLDYTGITAIIYGISALAIGCYKMWIHRDSMRSREFKQGAGLAVSGAVTLVVTYHFSRSKSESKAPEKPGMCDAADSLKFDLGQALRERECLKEVYSLPGSIQTETFFNLVGGRESYCRLPEVAVATAVRSKQPIAVLADGLKPYVRCAIDGCDFSVPGAQFMEYTPHQWNSLRDWTAVRTWVGAWEGRDPAIVLRQRALGSPQTRTQFFQRVLFNRFSRGVLVGHEGKEMLPLRECLYNSDIVSSPMDCLAIKDFRDDCIYGFEPGDPPVALGFLKIESK